MSCPVESLRVSCVISAYDRPDFLPAAIDSALQQSRPVHEIIVVDDCSPRDVAGAVAPFADRVRYLRLDRNRGPSGARNVGVAAAQGDVVAFLDDDDQWTRDKIARQLARLADGHEAALCGWRPIGGRIDHVYRFDRIDEPLLRWGNIYCGTSGLMARRQALLEETFDEGIRWGEEWDLYVRLAKRMPLAYEADALFLRFVGQQHEGITASRPHISFEEIRASTQAVRKHRGWFGEPAYRRALARCMLDCIKRRPDKLAQLRQVVRQTGVLPALAGLAQLALLAGQRRRRWRRASQLVIYPLLQSAQR